MQSITKVAVLLLLSTFLLSSCSQNNNSGDKTGPVVQPINPNGDSELALLMREMFEEAENIKGQIANEEAISLSLDYEKILTAHATEPEKAASPEYKAFAEIYLQTMSSLKTAGSDEVPLLYETMVANCTVCHKAFCPGPLVKIERLW